VTVVTSICDDIEATLERAGSSPKSRPSRVSAVKVDELRDWIWISTFRIADGGSFDIARRVTERNFLQGYE
jgi:hypothetical protein